MKKLYKEFSTFDVMKIVDVKRERLREWMKQGFVTPKIKAMGVGSKAVFELLDLYKIAIFKRIVEAGVNRRIAAKWVDSNPAMNDLQEVEKLYFILLLVNENGGGSWTSYFDPPWKLHQKEMMKDWQIGLLINVKRMRNDMNERLKDQ